MFRTTDTEFTPWTVVKSNDKKHARIEAMRSVLLRFAFADKDKDVVGIPIRASSAPRPHCSRRVRTYAALSPTRIAAEAAPEPGPGIHP